MAKHYHCPINGWDCPYYKDTDENDSNHCCICTLEDPYHDCSDFFEAYGEDCAEEDYTDNDDE